MGFVSRLIASERRDFSLANPGRWLMDWISGGSVSASGRHVNENVALTYSAVYACVRVIAETIASLPWIVYRRLPNGGKERAVSHRLYPLLHDAPNPEMTRSEFIETIVGHLELWGNAYAEIQVDNSGRVTGLWPLRPDRMTILEPNLDRPRSYIYLLPDGTQTAFLPYEILHFRALSPDGYIGYSPIRLAREAIGLGLAAEEFGARFFANDSRPGGVLQHPGRLSESAAKRLKESWEDLHRSLTNKHRVAILEEGITWQSIGIPPEDAQFLETRKFQVEEIARIFRVPLHKIQNLDRATFCLPANAEIFTAEGPRRIVDIRLGDLVWSRQDSGGLVLSPVEGVGQSGIDTILRISTTDRVIRLNARHRMLVRRAKERPALPGEKGGRNRNGRKFRVEWVTEYLSAGELRVGDILVAFNGAPDSGNWSTPTRPATIGFMEFCGLYLGDGYMTKGHVTIARATNAPYMDHYRSVIRQEFSRLDGGNGRGDRSLVPHTAVTITEAERYTRFASVEAAEELRALGFGGTAHEKRVPSWVFGMADEAKLAFLRGFLDADGSVDKKGRCSFSSCNRDMLSDIRHLCMSLGIPVTNITERMGETRLPNGRRTCVHQYVFTCSDPGANRRIGSHDPRYVARLESGKPFGRKARHYPRHGGHGFAEQGLELSRIVSIDLESAEPVYDLAVSGTHSFIADGLVVHNSNIEHQAIEFVVDTIRPRCVRLEQRVNQQLFSEQFRQTHFSEFLLDGLLRGDIKSRYEAYQSARYAGWMTTNEIRERENLNPLPGGDDLWMPSNMLPAGQSPDLSPEGGMSSGNIAS